MDAALLVEQARENGDKGSQLGQADDLDRIVSEVDGTKAEASESLIKLVYFPSCALTHAVLLFHRALIHIHI